MSQPDKATAYVLTMHALAVLPVTIMGAILVSPAFPRLLGRRREEPAQESRLAGLAGARVLAGEKRKLASPCAGRSRAPRPACAGAPRRVVSVGLDRPPLLARHARPRPPGRARARSGPPRRRPRAVPRRTGRTSAASSARRSASRAPLDVVLRRLDGLAEREVDPRPPADERVVGDRRAGEIAAGRPRRTSAPIPGRIGPISPSGDGRPSGKTTSTLPSRTICRRGCGSRRRPGRHGGPEVLEAAAVLPGEIGCQRRSAYSPRSTSLGARGPAQPAARGALRAGRPPVSSASSVVERRSRRLAAKHLPDARDRGAPDREDVDEREASARRRPGRGAAEPAAGARAGSPAKNPGRNMSSRAAKWSRPAVAPAAHREVERRADDGHVGLAPVRDRDERARRPARSAPRSSASTRNAACE